MNFKFHDNQYIEHIESGEVAKVFPRIDSTRELTRMNFPDEDDADFYVIEFFHSINSAFGGNMPAIRRKEWVEKNFKPHKRLQDETELKKATETIEAMEKRGEFPKGTIKCWIKYVKEKLFCK